LSLPRIPVNPEQVEVPRDLGFLDRLRVGMADLRRADPTAIVGIPRPIGLEDWGIFLHDESRIFAYFPNCNVSAA
jgi:hypothetical protein